MFYLFNAKPSNIGLLRTLHIEQQTEDAVVPFKFFTEKEIRKLWSQSKNIHGGPNFCILNSGI